MAGYSVGGRWHEPERSPHAPIFLPGRAKKPIIQREKTLVTLIVIFSPIDKGKTIYVSVRTGYTLCNRESNSTARPRSVVRWARSHSLGPRTSARHSSVRNLPLAPSTTPGQHGPQGGRVGSFAGSPEPLRNLMYGDTTLLTAAILLVLRAMGPAGTPRAVVR